MASDPRCTGTTPLYTSILSDKLTGILFSDMALPSTSTGTPSIKYLTDLPDRPLIEKLKLEPSPPCSRIRIPVVRFSTWLISAVVLANCFVSTTFTEKPECFTSRALFTAVTVTSSSCCSSFNNINSSGCFDAPVITTSCVWVI